MELTLVLLVLTVIMSGKLFLHAIFEFFFNSGNRLIILFFS